MQMEKRKNKKDMCNLGVVMSIRIKPNEYIYSQSPLHPLLDHPFPKSNGHVQGVNSLRSCT